MNVLVIDNYDSFVYNLVYLLKELGAKVDVFRNDKISLEEVAAYDFTFAGSWNSIGGRNHVRFIEGI